MDGHFVPNITFGPPVVKAIRGRTDEALRLPPDDRAGRPLSRGLRRGRRRHHHRACGGRAASRPLAAGDPDLGKKAGVSLNPSTPESAIEYVLDRLDLILVMTVNPGFGGQAFIPAVVDKVKRVKAHDRRPADRHRDRRRRHARDRAAGRRSRRRCAGRRLGRLSRAAAATPIASNIAAIRRAADGGVRRAA